MGFPSPASDYVESRIDLNSICQCTDPSVRMIIAERSHGKHIVAGTCLLVSSSIKPAEGNLLIAQINGEIDVWRLETIMRHGLASLIDDTFIPFGDSFTDDEIVIEGVVTFIIYDARNDVFDDSPCM